MKEKKNPCMVDFLIFFFREYLENIPYVKKKKISSWLVPDLRTSQQFSNHELNNGNHQNRQAVLKYQQDMEMKEKGR